MATAPSESREILRPCDLCRRGKRRCDGPYQPDRVCSRCRQLSKVCSYVDPAEYTGSTAQRYIDALQARCEKLKHCSSSAFRRHF
ncbi:hypothetical protein BKA62DRAFT_501892 [Auriculariales sp. MPI-PUGE-AT-0066]|nr:hypothetical protein BKA62DRAFT_501892 [Auriculariales sp. MPI-PUGE-AT-0066]